MTDSLLSIHRIDSPPAEYLASIGEVFQTFGALTQDSGNVSFGLQLGDKRYFVKTTDPDADVYIDHAGRVELLRNARRLSQSCTHGALPVLHNIIESPTGPMLVYDWLDGELLRGEQGDPQSALVRFRRLPVEEILAVLDTIYEVHSELADAGWIAVDFYDGSTIYDFERQEIHLVDLDNYHQGNYQNNMGRMFGSTRFMAPEEFELGAEIDQRTSLFTMGRTAAVLLSDASLNREPFRGSNALHEVVLRACQQDPKQRYESMQRFNAEWQSARQL